MGIRSFEDFKNKMVPVYQHIQFAKNGAIEFSPLRKKNILMHGKLFFSLMIAKIEIS